MNTYKEQNEMPSTTMLRMSLIAIMLSVMLLMRSSVHAQPGYSSLKSVHFEAKYQKGVTEEEAKMTLEYLESEHEYFVKTLGLELKKSLEVRLYGAVGPYLEQSKQSKPWRLAVYQKNVLHVQPLKELARQHMFEKCLSYELSLAVLEQARMQGCPRWMCEAFAVYHSGMITDLEAPMGMSISAFADVDQQLQQFAVPPRRDDVLYVVGQTMQYFVEKFGEDKALSLFAAFDGSQSTLNVFKAHFGRDMKEIEQSWSTEMNSRLKPFKRKE